MDISNFWWSSGAAGTGGFSISNSLRFRGAQFLRVTGSFNQSGIFALSVWVKRGKLGSGQTYFSKEVTTNANHFKFTSSDTMQTAGGGSSNTSSALFRDPNAWYHIFSRRTGASNAGEMYVNGVKVSGINKLMSLANTNIQTEIGRKRNGTTEYFDGYMAEFHVVTAADYPDLPSQADFGEFNADGVWVPKEYTGGHGNGFYLDFSDPSDIGADRSGNGRDFTANGFELATQTSADWDHMDDTPTNNATTLNPLPPFINNWYGIDKANLEGDCASTSTAFLQAFYQSTAFKLPDSGKYFFAYHNDGNTASDDRLFGVNLRANADVFPNDQNSVPQDGIYSIIRFGNQYRYQVGENASGANANLSNQPGNSLPHGTAVMAYDADTGNVWCGMAFPPAHPSFNSGQIIWYQDDASVGGDPVAETDPTFTVTGDQYIAYFNSRRASGGTQTNVNACVLGSSTAQADALVQKPAGYEYLNSESIPAADIPKPTDHFRVLTGAGNIIRDIAKGTNENGTNWNTEINTGFGSGLWWIKDRANSNDNQLLDSVRGGNFTFTSPSKQKEVAYAQPAGNSVAWCWKAGGAAVTNNDGTIETQVSANTAAGFSIMTYTGDGVNGATIGHGLSKAPEFVMVGSRTLVNYIQIYHVSMGPTNHLVLNTSDNKVGASNRWNSTAPNNSVITLGNADSTNKTATDTYVCYAWHPVPGYSAFGEYIGNNNNDGPFVYLGFRPAFLMTKLWVGNPTGTWSIIDSTRDLSNVSNHELKPSSKNTEATNGAQVDLLANGFKLRSGNSNVNNANYLYMAFAENPFGGSNVTPANAR